MLQSDSATIADACEEWVTLLQVESLNPHRQKIMGRFMSAVTPHHLLANILDPQYKGQNLTTDQVEMAKQTLIEKSLSLLPALYCFQTQSTPFPASMYSTMCVQNLNPTVWWDCVKKTGDGVPAELCNLASLLLKLPASPASIERIYFQTLEMFSPSYVIVLV